MEEKISGSMLSTYSSNQARGRKLCIIMSLRMVCASLLETTLLASGYCRRRHRRYTQSSGGAVTIVAKGRPARRWVDPIRRPYCRWGRAGRILRDCAVARFSMTAANVLLPGLAALALFGFPIRACY